MSSSVAVKSSPDNSSTDLFVLHEGTLVRTISELGEWREITIADGKKGWVEQDAIEVI
jgi:SH3-like domain-containing protein